MERDRDTSERQRQRLRLTGSGGPSLGRLLDDSVGPAQHGGGRRDLPRDRPRAEDLMAEEERR